MPMRKAGSALEVMIAAYPGKVQRVVEEMIGTLVLLPSSSKNIDDGKSWDSASLEGEWVIFNGLALENIVQLRYRFISVLRFKKSNVRFRHFVRLLFLDVFYSH